MTPPATPPHGPTSRGRQGTPAPLVRLLINLAAPVLVYVLLRPRVHSEIIALAGGAAVPTACTVVAALWRRRLDAIGVFAIVCFAIGLLLVVATGGNELVFKLREEIWTGPLGLACLISVAARRPLFLVALQLAARRDAQVAELAGDPRACRISTVTTGTIGVILLVHALVIVALALTTSTTTFVALKPPFSLAIVGGGLAALVWWIRRQYTSRRAPLPPMGIAQTRTVKERRITMPTVAIPRTDITSEQISAALRDGLDDRYDVLPGKRITRIPLGGPQAAGPDEIVVGKGQSPMVRAQVTIIRRADRTDIRITPGGVAGDLVMNTFGIARKIRHVLLETSGIGS